MSTLGTIKSEPLDTQKERSARFTWSAVIGGFILVQFVMSGVAIYLATSDPTHAVIPNYHQQAMDHDKVLAARQESQRLGWKWIITLDPQQNTQGKRLITLQLRDARMKPLDGAVVSVQICHHARGNDRQTIHLQPVSDQPGTYCGEAVLLRTGVWQIDLTVRHFHDHFVDRVEKYWSFTQ